MKRVVSVRLLSWLLLVSLGFQLDADSAPDASAKPDAKADTSANAKSDTKGEEKVFEEPPLSVTAHSITVGSNTLKYHATAGYILLKEEEGKPLVRDAG